MNLYDIAIAKKLSGGGGGGGGGDSFATVTFYNSGGPGTIYSLNYLVCSDESEPPAVMRMFMDVEESLTIKIPLYKGAAYMDPQNDLENLDMGVMPTFTGGVSLDMGTLGIIITGDGTMTANGR